MKNLLRWNLLRRMSRGYLALWIRRPSAYCAHNRANRDLWYFSRLKNYYSGRRGFVIGNGPSLKVSDLNKLQPEICIASNRIYLAFGETTWRPTFYTIADPLVWTKYAASLRSHVDSVIIPSYLDPRLTDARVRVINHLGLASDGGEEMRFSSDLTQGAFGGDTVTYENLQLAVHLGFNPIYLLGFDHYFPGQVDSRGATVVHSGESNHFHPDYRSVGEVALTAPIESMNRSFSKAATFARTRGISILNASRVSHLETFPKISFDELI